MTSIKNRLVWLLGASILVLLGVSVSDGMHRDAADRHMSALSGDLDLAYRASLELEINVSEYSLGIDNFLASPKESHLVRIEDSRADFERELPVVHALAEPEVAALAQRLDQTWHRYRSAAEGLIEIVHVHDQLLGQYLAELSRLDGLIDRYVQDRPSAEVAHLHDVLRQGIRASLEMRAARSNRTDVLGTHELEEVASVDRSGQLSKTVEAIAALGERISALEKRIDGREREIHRFRVELDDLLDEGLQPALAGIRTRELSIARAFLLRANRISALGHAVGVLLLVAFGVWTYRQMSRELSRVADHMRAAADNGLESTPLFARLEELQGAATAFNELQAARRAAEASLRRAHEEIWRESFDVLDDAIVLIDENGVAIRANRVADALVSSDQTGLVGRRLKDISPAEFWGRVSTALGELKDRTISFDAMLSDGKTWRIACGRVPATGGAIMVASDVSDRLRLERQVEIQKRQAQLGALIGGVAHEVRNPLFGITGTLDAFELAAGKDPAFSPYLETMRGEVERMTDLLADLLEFGKPVELDSGEHLAVRLVEQALRQCSALAEGAGVKANITGSGDSIAVVVDGQRMIGAIRNVIENAIQHSPRGSSIDVAIDRSASDGHVTISVQDAGPGVAEEDINRIFEPFYSRRKGGTGLGLAIVEWVVVQHHGTTRAMTHAPAGLRVEIVLPCAE